MTHSLTSAVRITWEAKRDDTAVRHWFKQVELSKIVDPSKYMNLSLT